MTKNFYDLELCLLTADTGTCGEGNQRRWFYDNSKGECIAFIYSGCGGNANNFNSHTECWQTCRQVYNFAFERKFSQKILTFGFSLSDSIDRFKSFQLS